MKIVYEDIAPGSADEAVFTSNDKAAFSDMLLSPGGCPAAATIEKRRWKLDGSFGLFDPAGHHGFWSSYCSDADGAFASPPQLLVSNPNGTWTATGVTLTFDEAAGEYCRSVNIKWYAGSSLLADEDFAISSVSFACSRTVENFDSVLLTFDSTSAPQRFAKVAQLMIGQYIVFGPDELSSVTAHDEVEPLSTSAIVSTLDFALCDKYGRAFRFQDRQKMALYDADELVSFYYVDEANQFSDVNFEVSCIDAIGVLDDSTFLGGLYTDYPVADLIEDILGGFFSYTLDPTFAGRTVSGYLKVDTRRAALSQVAFAIGAMLITNGSTGIDIRPMPLYSTKAIPSNRIFSGGSVTLDPVVTGVELCAYRYDQAEGTAQVYKGTVNGTVTLTFSEPHFGYAASGGTIDASGANWVTVTAAGEVTITAGKYDASKTQHSAVNPDATTAAKENIIAVDDCTLANSANAADILARMLAYYQNRSTYSAKVLLQDEKAGGMYTALKPFSGSAIGWITLMDKTYTGRNVFAEIEMRGKQAGLGGVWWYAGEVSSGEVTA